MGHQVTQMDVESLQKSGSRRGRCLDTFLVVSIIFLFVAVTAVAAGGVICVMGLKSQLDLHAAPYPGAPEPTSYQKYKMENFAYLRAEKNKLVTGNMALAEFDYGDGTSVGSNFDFNPKQFSLQPKKEGTYFVYTDLIFTCTQTCPQGVVTVNVGDKLTCEVELPERSEPSATPVSKRCWTVTRIESEKLHTHMTLPKTGFHNWQLELKGSGLGVFLVD
ncbi:uncharacterized protein LOC141810276 [Halichoeres trimaculatus]|uniref:uncharacterized protein LOC141810276 n=1 Tax=Halichoeres trimaculatus TaxID=147232 RepID=UPI003D9DF65D